MNWFIYGEFTLGFYMYDICRVGTFAGSIDKMDASTYSSGPPTIFTKVTYQNVHGERRYIDMRVFTFENLLKEDIPKFLRYENIP